MNTYDCLFINWETLVVIEWRRRDETIEQCRRAFVRTTTLSRNPGDSYTLLVVPATDEPECTMFLRMDDNELRAMARKARKR